MGYYKNCLLVCGGTGCRASESSLIISKLREEIRKNGLDGEVEVIRTGCFGFCEKGPNIKFIPDNTFYTEVKPEDCEELVSEHIIRGRKVRRLLYTDPETSDYVEDSKHMNFYKKQMRVVLRNCGFIDPENIDEYICRDGYSALGRLLTTMTPEQGIEIIKRSGLRGRGGAGFPTGQKWEFAAKTEADQKYVICNADEGDPGAFMDRSILEGDPNSVIEGMAICGYCIGASRGIIYIRAEYPLAIRRLQIAIEQARAYGFLGDDIFGTSFSFDVELRYGAGAFVCGEETAMIHSIEGGRGEPTLRPPYPAVKGYLGKPTNVNNVETLENVPVIFNRGADWFSGIGTENSKGTKVFALAGKINNVGLIEVPMGTTLREIIFEIGGGIKDGKKFKAVQTGGPSGGCLTVNHLDTPIDFDSLIAAGSMMGSGGMIVMDEEDCMVAVARFFLNFIVEESCGRCAPCRIGNKRIYEVLERICGGKGVMEDLDYLKNLSNVIKDTALCGLGQSAPNPVLSTMNNFYDEYITHVKYRKCPAGSCKALKFYSILPNLCTGCTLCSRICPVGAISGEKRRPHAIDPVKCIRCGLCYDKCKFKAIHIQ